MAKGNSQKKKPSAKKPSPKVEKVEVSEATEAVVEDKAEKVIQKLEKVAPKKAPEKKLSEPTVEDRIMEAKAYLTEASEMLMKLATDLEKAGKSGDRFRGASKDIEYMNMNRIIV